MLALVVEFLTGRYVATCYNDRDRSEWPPHPSRLFSALVETWAHDEGTSEEWAALEWLERQPPPVIQASPASERTVHPTFVPVNDTRTVSEPSRAREKLREAEERLVQARESGSEEAQAKAETALEKARVKLLADSKKEASDDKVTKKGVQAAHRMLPESRLRMSRTFPVMIPTSPRVRFVWGEAPPPEVDAALRSISARLIRLGHSSSLVRVCVERTLDVAPAAGFSVLEPGQHGEEVVRVPEAGQLQRLVDAHARHRGVEARVLPTGFARYGATTDGSGRDLSASVFGADWMVFERVGGERFPVTRVADVATAFRGAILAHGDEPESSLLSGHSSSGEPSDQPHLAYVPLPYVGSEYARGEILGLAVVAPRSSSTDERRPLSRAVGLWEQASRNQSGELEDETPVLTLTLGRGGVLRLRRVAFGESSRSTLQSGTWCRPARVWITATPVALDRNPGDLRSDDPGRRQKAFEAAEDTIARACLHVGLPEPEYVEVTRSATLPGGAKPRAFPPFPRADGKPRRVLVNARLVFAEPARGPILLGAGRYFGLGLFRPVRARQP